MLYKVPIIVIKVEVLITLILIASIMVVCHGADMIIIMSHETQSMDID